MTSELIAQAEAALSALEWHYHQGYPNQLTDIPRKRDAKIIRELKTTLRAQAKQPAEPQGEPVACCAKTSIGELHGFRAIEHKVKTEEFCRIMGQNFVLLYARPDPRVSMLEGLLREALKTLLDWRLSVGLRERIEAALGGGDDAWPTYSANSVLLLPCLVLDSHLLHPPGKMRAG